MSKLKAEYNLDYSYSGDTVDEFGQGYIKNQAQIFTILNALRTNQLVPNVEPEAYMFKVEDNKIYIRDANNEKWVKLLEVAEDGGLKAKTVGKSYAGAANAMPTTGVSDYDRYMSLDDGRYYYYYGGKWNLLLSLNVKDLNGYQNLVKKDDVVAPSNTTQIISSPQKLVRTNGNGNLPVNISGNAAMIAGKNIKADELNDQDILVYDEKNNRFTNTDAKKFFNITANAGALKFYFDDEGYICADYDTEEG